jgi:hypothetical protein
MIRGAWLAYVRKVNGAALGATADLEEFLFGTGAARSVPNPAGSGRDAERCNGAKGSMLAAEEPLGRWAERNRTFGPVIAEACDHVRMVHDLGASVQIARWAYEQVVAAGGVLWLARGALVPVTEQWRQALG